MFETRSLPVQPDLQAPDGSDVRVLLRLDGGSMAHFELAAGRTSIAVAHRKVEEIWYIVGGGGEMWRHDADGESITELEPGVCLTIPLGASFQFRSLGPGPLAAVAITMPPWPDRDDEAYEVEGAWPPSLQ